MNKSAKINHDLHLDENIILSDVVTSIIHSSIIWKMSDKFVLRDLIRIRSFKHTCRFFLLISLPTIVVC